MQVPLAQTVAPFQSPPPHCPYNGAVPPLAAEVVAALDVVVLVALLLVTIVVRVVAGGFVGEPPAPQVKGAGPGIVYDVKV